MLPLTLSAPKPLLRVGGKVVLDYIFDALPEEVNQVIIVVGYLKKKIQQHFGAKYQGRPIRYIVQNVLNGSGPALLCCKDLFSPGERFLVMYADDMPNRKEIAECLKHKYSWLCVTTDNSKQSGEAVVSGDGHILEVVEKPEHPVSNVVAVGTMVVNSDIFSYTPVQHSNGEYYLTSLMSQFAASHKIKAVYGRQRPGFLSPDEIEKINLNISDWV